MSTDLQPIPSNLDPTISNFEQQMQSGVQAMTAFFQFLNQSIPDLGSQSPASVSGAASNAIQAQINQFLDMFSDIFSTPDNVIPNTHIAFASDPQVEAPVTDEVTLDANAVYLGQGRYLLSGNASSSAGVKSVDITAEVDGVTTDLGTASLDRNGDFALVDHVGSHVQSSITATLTDGIGATASATPPISLEAGIHGAPFQAREVNYAAASAAIESFDDAMKNGRRRVVVEATDQTLSSRYGDTFVNGGTAGSRFVFTPGYGHDVIDGFAAHGSGHDTLSLASSDFTSLVDVLRHTQQTAAGAEIHDVATGDTILLSGVTKADLTRHSKQDVTFHP